MKTPDFNELTTEHVGLKVQRVPSSPEKPDPLTPESNAEWTAPVEANSAHFERRQTHRPLPPRTSTSVKVQRFLNQIVYKIVGSKTYRVGFIVAVFLSIFSIWFWTTQRIPIIDVTYQDLLKRGTLETEILELKTTLAEYEALGLSEGIETAEQRSVFSDYQKLAVWLYEQRDAAKDQGLTLTYQMGDSQRSLFDGMIEVPVSLTLSPSPDANKDQYETTMNFLLSLLSTSNHIDIQSASVTSQFDTPFNMVLKIRIWVNGRVQ